MRIVAGRFRGLRLAAGEGPAVRPTADRTREALFNLLAHREAFRSSAGPAPEGLRVLDVFAGTGALGLEALSRGAAHVEFIENEPAALVVLRANIRKARAETRTTVLVRDGTAPGRTAQPFDLVLMDPPYGQGLAARALEALVREEWLAPDAIVVVETERKEKVDWPAGLEEVDRRIYGRAALTIARG